MDKCLCHTINRLVNDYDESPSINLIPAVNNFLRDLRAILGRSKSLTRDVHYQIIPSNQRTMKVLSVNSVNLTPANQVWERYKEDLEGFWALTTDDAVSAELRRRLACVVIFLRSKLDSEAPLPPQIANLFQGIKSYPDLRNAGRKYIKIGRKLGGIGSLLWLPQEIPPSTYERYLNIDDEEAFSHLKSLGPNDEKYTEFVQHLILSQVRYPPLSCSYYNLSVDYGDVVLASDQLLLLLHALGGSAIPDIVLKSARFPQRRWTADGEIEKTSAAKFGLPLELIGILSNDIELSQATAIPYIIKHDLDDGTILWSLCPELDSFFSNTLLPQTIDELGVIALKMICFVCPPCYEGNTDWSLSLKKAIWMLLERALNKNKVPVLLKTYVLDAILYFGERDSVAVRNTAVEHARRLLRNSMPYYLHASVVLFQSTLYRLDGEFAKSEARILDFLRRGPQPMTRRDHALRGRLHISQIENKIKCYDNDVPSFIYKWEAEQPLSALDTEVTSRLQTAAARFFHSIGDFGAARVSLEQFLSLNVAKPIRVGTRHIIVSRLADLYCEMKEYSKAVQILQPELDSVNEPNSRRRSFRRLLLALVEAYIGLGRLEGSELVLKKLEDAEPPELDDLHDQQLHMRRLLAAARIAHLGPSRDEAVLQWKYALQRVESMPTLKSKHGFIAAMIYIFMAHAQLTSGDKDAGRCAWATGMEILRMEKCEYWIPLIPTIWLQNIIQEVHQLQGWSFRMILPGGRPDMRWP